LNSLVFLFEITYNGFKLVAKSEPSRWTGPRKELCQLLCGVSLFIQAGVFDSEFNKRAERHKRRNAMNIYVGNLSYEVTGEDLRLAFEAYGQVSSANVVKDKFSGQSRGFGFVEMPEKAEAQTAIQNLNGKDLKGQQMNVNEARPRADHGKGGRPGGGGQGRGRGFGGGGGGGGRGRY
jgi:uncharacterized membrane protein YgcG